MHPVGDSCAAQRLHYRKQDDMLPLDGASRTPVQRRTVHEARRSSFMKPDPNSHLSAPAGALIASPRFDTVEAAQKPLLEQGVSYVLAQFVDIHGVAKAKSVPVSHLPSVMNEGAGF